MDYPNARPGGPGFGFSSSNNPLLRNFRVKAAGCQTKAVRAVAASATLLGYASTLCVFLYDAVSFELRGVLAGEHDAALLCIAFHPNPRPGTELLASCSRCGVVCVWDAVRCRKLAVLQLGAASGALALDWSPRGDSPRSNFLALSLITGDLKVWEVADGGPSPASARDLVSVRSHKSMGLVCRFSGRDGWRLATGHSDGSVLLTYCEADGRVSDRGDHQSLKPHAAAKASANLACRVVDLQWDPLSDVYLLAAYAHSQMVLWDATSRQPMRVYDSVHCGGLRGVAWLPWAPGSFATVASKAGVVREWNVSQPGPQRSNRLSGVGATSLAFAAHGSGAEPRCLVGFADGSVVAFHAPRRQAEW